MAQMLSSLPIGAKVKFGKHSINGETPQDIRWLIANINGTVVTLITSEIIDIRVFDAIESVNTDASNNYGESNIRQWLNSSELSWYVAQHGNDTPPSDIASAGNTHYANRPGFLYHFSTSERGALLTTPIVTGRAYSPTTYTTNDKVFLPSLTEVSGGGGEGVKFSLFEGVSDLKCVNTEQVALYSLINVQQVMSRSWWLRTPQNNISTQVRIVSHSGDLSAAYARDGSIGVRPCINLNTIKVSDATDGDGCYTILWNTAPTQPTTLNVPPIYGGKSNSISWSKAIDAEGDTITYQLECSMNGGDYVRLYNGTSTTYAHLVPFGTTSVTYRVKATDPSGESSAYTTSATVTVINNNAPVISGADASLGVKSSGFTGTYTITDANSDAVTVTEAIDGIRIRSLVATLGEEITYGVTDNTWLALPNGSHTLTISATDGIDTTVRTIVFTKLVDTFKIQNTTPWVSSTMPSRIMLVVTRNIPSTATFKVEVCNNGYDTYPTWEDATDAVRSGLVHVFANKIKTAGSWGVLIRVTVERNGATGACYVSAIGGNFE